MDIIIKYTLREHKESTCSKSVKSFHINKMFSGQVNSIMKKLVGDNPEKDFAVLNKEAAAIEGDESSIEISQKSSKRDSFVVVFNPQLRVLLFNL